jgi:hypothetical protein
MNDTTELLALGVHDVDSVTAAAIHVARGIDLHAVRPELAQLAGRPALVDAYAQGPVEALIISPDQLRVLLIAEAELGERIMRALILRRVGRIETGAGGPVIVGRADNGDVLRLEGFLSRNGHPHQRLNPETDPEAKALILLSQKVAPDPD